MDFFKALVATAVVTSSIFATTIASADTYRAGDFTVTLNENANGRTYKGCDSQARCVNLAGGTAWRDGGYRGITWDNGEYSYSISWREGRTPKEPMYLNVYRNNTRILRRQLIPVHSPSDVK